MPSRRKSDSESDVLKVRLPKDLRERCDRASWFLIILNKKGINSGVSLMGRCPRCGLEPRPAGCRPSLPLWHRDGGGVFPT